MNMMDAATQASLAVASLTGARKRYGGVDALAGFDLTLQRGQVLALLGANGAGKTTAIGLMLGLIAPDAGQVELFGQAPQALAARRRMGVMLQSAALPDTSTIKELLEATRAYYPAPLSYAECESLAGLQGLGKRQYGKLSGGQQRRVQFALAICGDPELMFLDEPTTGLDIEARQQIWLAIRQLRERGAAVLLTTHYLEEAEALADHVVVIDRGRAVASGSVEAIRAKVSEQRIRCRSDVEPVIAMNWPGVLQATREGDHLTLRVEDAVQVLPLLLSADRSLSALEVGRAGLADAFLAITRESTKESLA